MLKQLKLYSPLTVHSALGYVDKLLIQSLLTVQSTVKAWPFKCLGSSFYFFFLRPSDQPMLLLARKMTSAQLVASCDHVTLIIPESQWKAAGFCSLLCQLELSLNLVLYPLAKSSVTLSMLHLSLYQGQRCLKLFSVLKIFFSLEIFPGSVQFLPVKLSLIKALSVESLF